MFTMAFPSHPGAFIRDEIFGPNELSVTSASKALGVTRPALSALINERAALSPEMALRIEKAFGLSMETMLSMQLAFDIAKARRLAKSIQVKKWSPPKRARATKQNSSRKDAGTSQQNSAPKRAVRQARTMKTASR